MAYRTRKHTTTGFTPFELMFGRPMLTFEDWTPLKPENETQELLVRSKEIKELIENTHPDTVSHIVQQQVRQRKIQNDNNNITTEAIRDGTTVYIRSMKIQNKLKDKYYGPYTVKGRTDNGNYILNNLRGTEMRQTYPLAHLKVMEEPAQRIIHSYEIRRILNHRDFHGTMEYQIQWKDLPDDETSWVPDTDMDSLDLIHEYWNEKTRPADLLLTQATQRHCRASFATRHSFLYQVLVWLTLLTLLQAQDFIEGNFQLCDINSQKMVLNMKLPCASPVKLPHSDDPTVWHVLNKRQFMIDGKALVCKKHNIKILAGKSFPVIGGPKLERSEEHIDVSREECASMWDTKQCNTMAMECVDNSCRYYNEPTPDEYSYFDPIVFLTVYCEVSLIPLQRELLTDVIATGKYGNCYAKDASCKLGRTIMIWPESAIHQCPFTHLESGYFIQSHSFIYTPVETHHKKMQGANHLLFELEPSFKACGAYIYPTKEGLYVTNNVTDLDAFQNENITTRTIPYLELADADFTKFTVQQKLIEWQSSNTMALCYMFQSVLRYFAQDFRNKLLPIHDFKGNHLILYAHKGILYVPACTPITQFRFVKTETCFADIPVLVFTEQRNVTAFLTTTGVVVKTSFVIPCTDANFEFILQNRYFITVKKGVIAINGSNSSDFYKLDMERFQLPDLSFIHDELLTANIAPERPNSMFSHIMDGENQFHVIKDAGLDMQYQSAQYFRDKYQSAVDFLNSIKSHIVIWATVTIILLMLILILYCIFKRKSKAKDIRNWMTLMAASLRGTPPRGPTQPAVRVLPEEIPLNDVFSTAV